MERRYLKVLVTGFSSFEGVEVNPCVQLIEELAQERVITSEIVTDLHVAILPVSFQRANDAVRRLVQEYLPDVMVHFGVASRSTEPRLEQYAYNWREASISDVDGQRFQGELIDDLCAEECVASPVDVQRVLRNLSENGVQATSSIDPGRYVCNSVYWNSLKNFKGISVLFIHIPMTGIAVEVARNFIEVLCEQHILATG